MITVKVLSSQSTPPRKLQFFMEDSVANERTNERSAIWMENMKWHRLAQIENHSGTLSRNITVCEWHEIPLICCWWRVVEVDKRHPRIL